MRTEVLHWHVLKLKMNNLFDLVTITIFRLKINNTHWCILIILHISMYHDINWQSYKSSKWCINFDYIFVLKIRHTHWQKKNLTMEGNKLMAQIIIIYYSQRMSKSWFQKEKNVLFNKQPHKTITSTYFWWQNNNFAVHYTYM